MYLYYSHLKYPTNMFLMMFSHENVGICNHVRNALFHICQSKMMYKQHCIPSVHQYLYHIMLTGQWTSTWDIKYSCIMCCNAVSIQSIVQAWRNAVILMIKKFHNFDRKYDYAPMNSIDLIMCSIEGIPNGNSIVELWDRFCLWIILLLIWKKCVLRTCSSLINKNGIVSIN